jgi:medium-chain acyl-[acyl-carrier-protein] hydrolase
LRADLRLCDEYIYETSNKLRIPIVALRGNESSHCSSDAVLGWSELTTNDFMFITLPGDHFFIYKHPETIMSLLRNNTYYGETYAV